MADPRQHDAATAAKMAPAHRKDLSVAVVAPARTCRILVSSNNRAERVFRIKMETLPNEALARSALLVAGVDDLYPAVFACQGIFGIFQVGCAIPHRHKTARFDAILLG